MVDCLGYACSQMSESAAEARDIDHVLQNVQWSYIGLAVTQSKTTISASSPQRLPHTHITQGALRAFDAAARELNITHAAIAQHVRAVEAELKSSLVVREGRGIALTDAGLQLATALREGSSQIIAGVSAAAAEAETRPIALSVTSSFAENWLMPRFTKFWAEHPDFGLSIIPAHDAVDVRRYGIDMAIRYRLGEWPVLEAPPFIKAALDVRSDPQRGAAVGDIFGLEPCNQPNDRSRNLWHGHVCSQSREMPDSRLKHTGAR